MSDLLGRVPTFDEMSAMVPLPLWAAGGVAVFLIVFAVLVLSRAGRSSLAGALSRLALLAIGAGVAWFVLDVPFERDLAAQRRAFDARATELTGRALSPGSALACLDGAAGDLVEAACEKALFASPEATAAAVSYVAAQLAFLADATDYARRDRGYDAALVNLRRAVETDRFGIVAHVLMVRDGCTPSQCAFFVLLRDASRVSANMSERAYDGYIGRHAAAWPSVTAPVAALAPALPAAVSQAPVSTSTSRPPGANVFFPSSASIPPVSIMNAEPALPAASADPAVAPPALPGKPAQPPRRPTNINPAARAGPSPAQDAQ